MALEPRDQARGDERGLLHDEHSGDAPRIRRTHWKTKLGCLECKRRHLKCDENRPVCRRCQSRNASCVYQSTKRSLQLILDETPRPSEAMFSMALGYTAEALDRVLSLPGNLPLSVRDENLEMLRRFEACTSRTLGHPLACRVMRTEGMRLGFTSSTLMNAIIAVAITHFCHLNPSYKPTIPPEYYWNRAIARFRQNLHGESDEHNIEVMMSTCMMLAVHSFIVYDQTNSESWVFADNSTPNWLDIQGGLPVVRDKYQGLETTTMWKPIFEDGNTFRDSHVKCGRIDPVLAEVCGIDENEPGVENSPYYAALQTLSALKKIEPSSNNFSKLCLFIGCVRGQFRDLVARKDPCALLLLGSWFALLGKVDQWWLQSRAKFEFHAIYSYLEKTASDNPRILELLRSIRISPIHQRSIEER